MWCLYERFLSLRGGVSQSHELHDEAFKCWLGKPPWVAQYALSLALLSSNAHSVLYLMLPNHFTIGFVWRYLPGIGFGLGGGTHSQGAPRCHQPQAIGLLARLQAASQERLCLHVTMQSSQTYDKHALTNTTKMIIIKRRAKKKRREGERHITQPRMGLC